MKKSRAIVIAAAMAAPSLLALPGVMAETTTTVYEQEEQMLAIRDANAAAAAAGESEKPATFAPCVRGVAKGTDYGCDNVSLLSQVTPAQLGMSFVNDNWGWTAPDGEREWVLVGGDTGTAFVEVTDPRRPVVTGLLPQRGFARAIWRDMKVIDDVAYIGAEDIASGIQIFDLTRLLDAEPGTAFTEDATYDGFSSSHNIVALAATDTIVAVGTDTCGGGLHVVDVSDPANPSLRSCFGDHGYVHDAQCVVYDGPDTDHTGKSICISAAATFTGFSQAGILNALSVVDITDPFAPVALSYTSYDDGTDGYSHQGWLTDDQSTFLHGDELDEFFTGAGTSTRVWDVSDLDAPSLDAQLFNGNTSIDHNLFIDNGYVLAANYTSGLRVFDAADAANGVMNEVAYFDVTPSDDIARFAGAWAAHPYFAQEHLVALTSSDGGLFMLMTHLGEK